MKRKTARDCSAQLTPPFDPVQHCPAILTALQCYLSRWRRELWSWVAMANSCRLSLTCTLLVALYRRAPLALRTIIVQPSIFLFSLIPAVPRGRQVALQNSCHRTSPLWGKQASRVAAVARRAKEVRIRTGASSRPRQLGRRSVALGRPCAASSFVLDRAIVDDLPSTRDRLGGKWVRGAMLPVTNVLVDRLP